MKSTGEVLGIGKTLTEALYKGLTAAGYKFIEGGTVLITIADVYKQEAIPVAREFEKLGFKILATEGTSKVLNSNGIKAEVIEKVSQKHPNIEDAIKAGKINIIVNTPTHGRIPQRDGFKIRRFAVENSIPCMTSLDTAWAFINSFKLQKDNKNIDIICLHDI